MHEKEKGKNYPRSFFFIVCFSLSYTVMTILNDTHLAYLLSLGFELDLCKQALTQNSTLENATEWYKYICVK